MLHPRAKMIARIGINGFNRLARMILRAAITDERMQIIAINEPTGIPLEQMAYLTKFDSVRGTFQHDVRYTQEIIQTTKATEKLPPTEFKIDGNRIKVFSEKDYSKIPWGNESADYIIDCTNPISPIDPSKNGHIIGGAKKVIFPACTDENDQMLLFGINQEEYKPEKPIISTGDPQLNAIAPLWKILEGKFGIIDCLATSIRGNDEKLKIYDGKQKKGKLEWRIGRSGAMNVIPAKLDAVSHLRRVFKEAGVSKHRKIHGLEYFVPYTGPVSLMELNLKLENEALYEDICSTIMDAARHPLFGIIGYTEEDIVSQDLVDDTRSCIFDANAGVMLNAHTVKLVTWYDREWGLAHRILDLINFMVFVDSA